MICTIDWLDHTSNIGKECFENVNNANILQAPAYGMAMAGYKPRRETPKIGIIKVNQATAGYLQILQKSALRGLLQVVILDRGPLWLDGYGDLEHFQAFVQAFRRDFPPRIGRAVRILPEIQATPDVENILKAASFRRKSQPYQTIFIDLQKDKSLLRSELKKNWRGTLNKAEKQGLVVDWDGSKRYLDWFLKFYRFDMKTKGYQGASVELIKTLANQFIPDKGLMLGRALKDGRAVAAILIFCHGRGSTYQIGWNTQEGRLYGAHNLLLWNACLRLQNHGFKMFDLGGVNDTDAHTVKAFKEGMGGQLITLPGLYT